MNEWATRPLDDIYVAGFIDAIVVKIRETGKSATGRFMRRSGSAWPVRKTCWVRGRRPAVRPKLSSDGSVLTDSKNRGVADVFFLVCDGLKGLPEVVTNVWSATIVQTCLIHLIRNTFRLASKRDWDAYERDVKQIYTAVNATAARVAFDELTEKWGQRYPAIIRCGRTRGNRSSRSWTTTWRSASCCVPSTRSSR